MWIFLEMLQSLKMVVVRFTSMIARDHGSDNYDDKDKEQDEDGTAL